MIFGMIFAVVVLYIHMLDSRQYIRKYFADILAGREDSKSSNAVVDGGEDK